MERLREIRKAKEKRANIEALEIIKSMREGIEKYEKEKVEMSIEEKKEIMRNFAMNEERLTGLGETQQFAEEIKVC